MKNDDEKEDEKDEKVERVKMERRDI